jgi:phosphonate metabolism protein (transferase hexapeptide repeat family)
MQIDQFPASAGQARQLSETPTIHPSCRLRAVTLGVWTDLGPGCTLSETTFGDYSYAAGHVDIIYTDVGKFTSIAAYVRINPGNHPMDRVTQHHMTYRRAQYGLGPTDDDEFFAWRRAHRCTIGHDVWIGHGATIMPGVTIGTGAVVGAGAVVTRAVAPYTIVGGVPARLIRPRFDPATAERLLASAWWDWDRETLAARFDQLLDVRQFLNAAAD